MRRRSLGLAVAGAALVAAALRRRRESGPREHVELYYDEGDTVSLDVASQDGERVLGLARRALEIARAA